MKRIFIAGAFISFTVIIQAQNVGIGTATPAAKLNIVGVGSDPAIPGATSTGVFRIGITPNEGIDFGKTGFPTYAAWMQVGLNGIITDALSLQPLGGNVGIGTMSPTAKLHINGAMKIQGTNTLEFGAGVAKEINAGKIGYNSFGFDGLSIVGSGTTAVNRKVYVFAEGGTTFNGPINVGGSTGTAGQVLTSNGTAAPGWQSAAFNNNVRFEADCSGGNTTDVNPALNYTTAYNLNPSAVSISGTGITVNRSGLYHIEGFIYLRNDWTAYPTLLTRGLSVVIDGRDYVQAPVESLDKDPQRINGYIKYIRFVNEVFIAAPGNVRLFVTGALNVGPTASFISSYYYGKVSGYLISD